MKKALAAAAAAGAAVVLLGGMLGRRRRDRPDTAPAATPRISTPADEPTLVGTGERSVFEGGGVHQAGPQW